MLSGTAEEHKDKGSHWLAVISFIQASYDRTNCVISSSSWCDPTDHKVRVVLTNNTLNEQVLMMRYIDPLTKQSKTEEIVMVK